LHRESGKLEPAKEEKKENEVILCAKGLRGEGREINRYRDLWAQSDGVNCRDALRKLAQEKHRESLERYTFPKTENGSEKKKLQS